MVPQPSVGLLEEEGQALPPAPVRLEIIGIGEEDEIVELEELVRGGVDDTVAGGEEVDEGGDDVAEALILGPQERRVRGVAPGERGELAERLDPEVPGPIQGPLVQDASRWSDIDMFGAWECVLNPFNTMTSVPGPLESQWGKVVEKVLRAILTAPAESSLDRALKWFLILPQAFLRQSKRGGQAGRSSVAGRFNAAMDGDFGMVLRLL